MTNNTLIHAHEVFDLLDSAAQGLSVEELRQRCASTFGADAVFTNCSGLRFSFDALMTFALGRGRIALHDGRLVRLVDGCEHHEHH